MYNFGLNNLSNKTIFIIVGIVICVLLLLINLYKTRKEQFIILNETQDLATQIEDALLYSLDNVKFNTVSLTTAFSGGQATLNEILQDMYAKVDLAQATGDTAITTANEAKNTAANASTDAANADIKAANAETNSNTAKDFASAANTKADNALSFISTAQATAQEAHTIAESALDATRTLALLPIGSIITWNSTTLPRVNNKNVQHWAFCDGTNGTPDLRGRFVLGANPMGQTSAPTTLSRRALNTTGGAETHTLELAEMPAHSHSSDNSCNGRDGYSPAQNSFNSSSGDWGWFGKRAINFTGGDPALPQIPNVDTNTTNRQTTVNATRPHNNMPPYYVLTYIMKIR
jgi:microcystin-dependent protein